MTKANQKKPDKKPDKIEIPEDPKLENSNVNHGDGIYEKHEAKPDKKPDKKADETVYPRITLKIFCSLSGKKPDQIAGFRRYAMIQELDLLTVKQWQAKLVEFQNKPTR